MKKLFLILLLIGLVSITSHSYAERICYDTPDNLKIASCAVGGYSDKVFIDDVLVDNPQTCAQFTKARFKRLMNEDLEKFNLEVKIKKARTDAKTQTDQERSAW